MSDETVEPYTVLEVHRGYKRKYTYDTEGRWLPVTEDLWMFIIIYRNYTRRSEVRITAKDELEAFVLAQAHLDKTKRAYDRRKQREGAK